MSVNHIFRHYKGKHYKVLHIGLHTETKESMVVYEQLYTNQYPKHTVWIRPYDMFFDHVVMNDHKVLRFVLCPTVNDNIN